MARASRVLILFPFSEFPKAIHLRLHPLVLQSGVEESFLSRSRSIRRETYFALLNTGALNGIRLATSFGQCKHCLTIVISSCFNVDKAEGLTPISGTTRYLHLNQTSPLSGPVSGSASQVIFSEDNQLLIVAVKGLNGTTDAGYLAVWDVYENFTLSQDFNRVALPTGGFYPYSLMTISGQNAVLVTDPALGYEIFTNISGSSNTGEHRNIGVGSYARTIPNQLTTCWSAYSPISENYYLSDLADNRIAVISVDSDLNSTIVNVGGSILHRFIQPNLSSVHFTRK